MNEEALKICEKCREKQRKKYPQSINCAFLNDNMYCERLEDINTLIEKLLETEIKENDRKTKERTL